MSENKILYIPWKHTCKQIYYIKIFLDTVKQCEVSAITL